MSIKNKLHILGHGEWLGYAHATALELGRWSDVALTQIAKINEYTYDLNSYQKSEDGVEYFLALNGDAFGTVREKHLSDLVSRGFSFASLISEKYGRKINSLISPGVVIPEKLVNIGFNSLIGPNSIIGINVDIGRSVTIGANCELKNQAQLQKNVSLVHRVRIDEAVKVYSYSALESASHITASIRSGYIVNSLFERPVVISRNP